MMDRQIPTTTHTISKMGIPTCKTRLIFIVHLRRTDAASIESEQDFLIQIKAERKHFLHQIHQQQTDKQDQADSHQRQQQGEQRFAQGIVVGHHHAEEKQRYHPDDGNGIEHRVEHGFLRGEHMAHNEQRNAQVDIGLQGKAGGDKDILQAAFALHQGGETPVGYAPQQNGNHHPRQLEPDVDLIRRLAAEEKSAIMEAFRAGEFDVLVSTTIIEVGIDVPNATVMIIEDADRFGLAQLHQLRGRVGRGEKPGQVYLVTRSKAPAALERLRAMEVTEDGFELSEIDLAQRKEGDVFGARQHGQAALRLVNVVRDRAVIEAAYQDAYDIIYNDTLSEAERAILERERSMVSCRLNKERN